MLPSSAADADAACCGLFVMSRLLCTVVSLQTLDPACVCWCQMRQVSRVFSSFLLVHLIISSFLLAVPCALCPVPCTLYPYFPNPQVDAELHRHPRQPGPQL
jgi:hypothetical protein